MKNFILHFFTKHSEDYIYELSYMDWIEKYNVNFQLHIKENEDSHIYKQIDLKEVIENLQTFKNTVVDVISTTKFNNQYYFKVQYKNNLIGWCSPEENTIAYIKNRKQEINRSQYKENATFEGNRYYRPLGTY